MSPQAARVRTLGLLVAFSAACDSEPVGPEPTAVPLASSVAQACETITFNTFGQGDPINSLAVFGLNLTVTTTAGAAPSANQAVAFNTNSTTHPDFDLRHSGTGATCLACAGLGRVAVILDSRGFGGHGDSDGGGTIGITGFAGNGPFSVVSYKATSNNTFANSLAFVFDGSGAVDDIRICREEENGGGEGCTPGYWKQPHHFDSWADPYDPTDLFSEHFEDAFPGMTLVQVLGNGGGDLNALGRHTVAALLNSANSGVSFEESPAQVIAAFNSVFPGTKAQYTTLKNQFAALNERLCPLN
jgi:hypothetical protein